MANPIKFFKRRLRTLIFFVTAKCPLRCKHCFYIQELNNCSRIKELSLGEIAKIASHLKHLEYLQLSGGEPFARNDIPEIAEIFFKRGLKKLIIPSNGYMKESVLSQARKMKEKGFNFSITISIDGFAEMHNKIRGKDCFDKAMETFDGLKAMGVETGFIVSLSKLNYGEYLNLIKFLKKRTNSIDPVLVRAKPDIMLSAEEFQKIRPELERLVYSHLTPFYRQRKKLLNDIYSSVIKGKSVPYKCLAGKTIAVLEPDGEVRSCEIFGKLGNVRNYNYDINRVLKLSRIPNRCRNCIHPCFIGPSMSYSPKWMAKNIISQYV
jgi:MoaA/NifB/PqqE/SkfB family radical SAM enzyme